ncbi:MAG: hypothetical protein IKV16_05800 [Clostridia bacterium]|nr:hypothetical protein [Clostridia bacterium]
MNIFTVSLFGHREIPNLMELESKLFPIIRDLLRTEEYISFIIGRSGEFDEYAASIIKRAQKETGRANSDLTLVLPYSVADFEFYENYYDGIIIPENLSDAHYKAKITLKNRWMIENSNLVIVFVDHNSGGTYHAMKYGKRLNKRIINIADCTVFCD